MMTDLSDRSAVLTIFMSVTGIFKGDDQMNKILPSFYYLRIITYIMSIPLIISIYTNLLSVVQNVQKLR